MIPPTIRHRCTKDRHWFAYGPHGPCQCLKYLQCPDTRPEPVQVTEPVNRPQDRPPNTGQLTARILAACDRPKTSEAIAQELHTGKQQIRLMLSHLRRHGRVTVTAKIGRVALYSRVTAEPPQAQTVN